MNAPTLAITLAALLIPLQGLQSKTLGGFRKGSRFSFRVDKVVSVENSSGTGSRAVGIPRGLPRYKPGKRVRFKIGRKGELIAKGIRIPLTAPGTVSNTYSKVGTGKFPKTDGAIIFKDARGKASGASLYFTRVTGDGLNVKNYSLTYSFR